MKSACRFSATVARPCFVSHPRPPTLFRTTEASLPPPPKPAHLHHASAPLAGLQHVSLCVRDPDASVAFYRDVLGFAEVKRPSLEESFDGSW